MMGQVGKVAGAETADGKLSWSPQYDLRNCGIDAVRRTIEGLREVAWEPWFAEYMKLADLAEIDLGESVELYALAVAEYLKEPTGNIGEKLEAVGFFRQPLPCQLAIHGRMGQVFLGMFAHAILYSTGPADDPGLPYQKALERLLASGQEPLRKTRFTRLVERIRAWWAK